MNILIIDAPDECESIRSTACDVLKIQDISFEFSMSPEASWNVYCRNAKRYDAVIIDASRLKRGSQYVMEKVQAVRSFNSEIDVVFMSSVPMIAVEMLRIGCAGYIRKTMIEEDLKIVLERLGRRYNKRKHSLPEIFAVKCSDCVRMVHASQIIYIKKFKHGVIVVTDDDQFKCHYQFSQCMELVPENFCRCRDNTIVNFNHVSCVVNDAINFHNKEIIYISRLYKKDVKDFLKKHLLDEIICRKDLHILHE